MIRRFPLWLGLASIMVGCDYAPSNPPIHPTDVISGPLPTTNGRPQGSSSFVVSSEAEVPEDKLSAEEIRRGDVILANVMKLMQTASMNPGGPNFAIATDNLNELFEQGVKPSDLAYEPKNSDFLMKKIFELSGQDPEPVVKSFCSPKFTTRDARHIEDCMLYHAVATRVAGEGDDLARVRRIFDWIVRNVELVPPESLSGAGMRQAQVRPADALFRGMATEDGGRWSERGWLFMALCRQIGIDVGLITYSSRASVLASPSAAANRPTQIWICAAVVDDKAYLFDQRIGMEIPSPDGNSVATLEQAITDPSVLARLEMPGLSPYLGATAAGLAGSPTKIGILIDSSPGFYAPRMRVLQGRLRGKDRTILFRDALEQTRNFAKAIGPRLGSVTLWDLPVRIEELLFKDANFVASTQMSLQFFDSKLPLLYARTAQLRGDLTEATNKYVALRFADNAVMKDAKKTPIPAEIQRALDFYSTYFLAQIKLDEGNLEAAEDLYRKFLKLCPEPGPGRYFFYMLRWSAQANIARICEAKGDRSGAIAHYSNSNRTFDRQGNLLRARELALKQPFDEPVSPLPPAPPLGPGEQAPSTPTPTETPANPASVKAANR